jgi:putative ATPase
LQPQGKLVLAENLPKQGQRIYQLVDATRLGEKLSKRWAKAEDNIYDSTPDPRLAADLSSVKALFAASELTATVNLELYTTQLLITPTLLQRWFKSGQTTPSYGDQLQAHLSASDVEKIHQFLSEKLMEQVVPWQSATAWIVVK